LILASSAAKSTIDGFSNVSIYFVFSHLVSGEDFPESKPNPAIFIEAQRFLEMINPIALS
jgi:beta-phosphoglucomutase-like phosphatase (HAD superfamily)